MNYQLTLSAVLLSGLGACSETTEAQSIPPTQPSRAVPVWNQAYQENYESDSISDILANARGAYILVDPYKSEFDADGAGLVERLQANGNEVGAYVSVGTGENWRDDFDQLKPHLVSEEWDEWEGEYFVSTPNEAVLSVMKARIDFFADLGMDWVEFDNMDWASDQEYSDEYGIAASPEDGIEYYQKLCAHVHSRGMKCMAKNTANGVGMFDGVTYESYHDEKSWWDQSGAERFLSEEKLVVIFHYNERNCTGVYQDYVDVYGPDLSFACESRTQREFIHFNQ